MPYKDKKKRYEAIKRSRAKKPEHYRLLGLNNKRKAHRRGYMIERLYDLTMDEYLTILDKQNKCCAVCLSPTGFTKTGRFNLYVDHDHTTGKVRGLLCPRCNMLVSFLDEPSFYLKLGMAEKYIAENS